MYDNSFTFCRNLVGVASFHDFEELIPSIIVVDAICLQILLLCLCEPTISCITWPNSLTGWRHSSSRGLDSSSASFRHVVLQVPRA